MSRGGSMQDKLVDSKKRNPATALLAQRGSPTTAYLILKLCFQEMSISRGYGCLSLGRHERRRDCVRIGGRVAPALDRGVRCQAASVSRINSYLLESGVWRAVHVKVIVAPAPESCLSLANGAGHFGAGAHLLERSSFEGWCLTKVVSAPAVHIALRIDSTTVVP